MITQKTLTTTAVALFLNYSVHVWAGCNAPNNQGQYKIAITGGSGSAQDGENSIYTCTMTPSVSGVTPTWSLSPTGGGGNGLTAPSISTSGNSATVTFFWHDGGGEVSSCNYTLTCQTSPSCVVTESISVSLANPMGVCNGTFLAQISYIDLGVNSNEIRYAQCETSYVSTDIRLHSNSQFMNKTVVHEASHETDFTGGTSSPIAQRGSIVGNSWLMSNGHTRSVVNDSDFNRIENDMETYIDNDVIGPPGNTTSWTEKRAYAADKSVPPHYFEH